MKATTKTTTDKSFNHRGVSYRRTSRGYCYRGSDRISAKKFEEAEIEMLRDRQRSDERTMELARMAKLGDRIKNMVESEESGMNEGSSIRFEMNGHEYCKNWYTDEYTRDGEAISREQYETEVYDKKSARSSKRAARKSKDVAFEHEGVTLTAKQADFLRELGSAGEDILGDAQAGWWCDCIADAIGGQFAGKPMTVGAMISTLCEKGLGTRSKESRDQGNGRTKKVTSFALTDTGREVWHAMGLK